jgi:hypothetical protein
MDWKAADAGLVVAQLKLEWWYDNGYGVEQDAQLAVFCTIWAYVTRVVQESRYLKRPLNCFDRLYEFREGVPKDLSIALMRYKAAAQGLEIAKECVARLSVHTCATVLSRICCLVSHLPYTCVVSTGRSCCSLCFSSSYWQVQVPALLCARPIRAFIRAIAANKRVVERMHAPVLWDERARCAILTTPPSYSSQP